MLITVVIPTLNRARLLERTLNSLAAQDVDAAVEWEVLVMDNGSTDSTAALCARFAETFLPLRYHYVSAPGLHVGRNEGWLRSSGDIIAYLDDDVLVPKYWIAGISAAFHEEDIMLASGPVLPQFEVEPPRWLARRWFGQPEGARILGELSLIDLGAERRTTSPQHVYGCNFLVRRIVLELAGGFHPDGMPANSLHLRGDGESYITRFVEMQGWRALYEPRVGLRHIVTAERMCVAYFLERRFRQGISDSYTFTRANGLMPWWRLLASTLRSVLHSLFRGGQSFAECMAYSRGRIYHQWRLRRDPALIEWVRRVNYLGSSTIH